MYKSSFASVTGFDEITKEGTRLEFEDFSILETAFGHNFKSSERNLVSKLLKIVLVLKIEMCFEHKQECSDCR